jgi:hypothetical protein
MVGVLSLLNTLSGVEMCELVETLSIQKDMRETLLTRRGYLGHQLQLIEVHEKGEFERVSALLAELGFLSINEFIAMELEAPAWASRISGTIISGCLISVVRIVKIVNSHSLYDSLITKIPAHLKQSEDYCHQYQ